MKKETAKLLLELLNRDENNELVSKLRDNLIEDNYFSEETLEKLNLPQDSFQIFYDGVNSDTLDFDGKEIYVLWSGGYDSTALLHALACQYPDKQIYAVSVITYTGSRKTDNECRKKLKEKFKMFKNIEYKSIVIKPFMGSGAGLGQACLWLTALGNLVFGSDRAICFGYIREDDIWHYMKNFRAVFNNLKVVAMAENVSLCFPLEWRTKAEVIAYCERMGFADLCNCCERADNGGRCGYCKDCEKLDFYEWKKKKDAKKDKETDKALAMIKKKNAIENKLNKYIKDYNNKLKKQKIKLKDLDKIKLTKRQKEMILANPDEYGVLK